ncbi:phosphotransferase [Stagonosporopsis vannaccii]|nr:phosphotransferase [Stagonosporopsis vannaccii]
MDGRVITPEEFAQATKFDRFVPVYKIDAHTVVKTGDCVRLAEAEAMKLVREKTTIPVPKVHNAYINDATGYPLIVMDFIEGECLADVWDGFDDGQKEEIIFQLRHYFSQLREIKGTFIGSVDGTACEDQLFTDVPSAFGPYKDEAAFNEGIIAALKAMSSGGWLETICDMVSSLRGHEIVLTHGDISPRNIMVHGSKVVAILDWELSGYYPEYWEHSKALYRPDWQSGWIKDRAVQRVLEHYHPELAVMLHVNGVAGW